MKRYVIFLMIECLYVLPSAVPSITEQLEKISPGSPLLQTTNEDLLNQLGKLNTNEAISISDHFFQPSNPEKYAKWPIIAFMIVSTHPKTKDVIIKKIKDNNIIGEIVTSLYDLSYYESPETYFGKLRTFTNYAKLLSLLDANTTTRLAYMLSVEAVFARLLYNLKSLLVDEILTDISILKATQYKSAEEDIKNYQQEIKKIQEQKDLIAKYQKYLKQFLLETKDIPSTLVFKYIPEEKLLSEETVFKDLFRVIDLQTMQEIATSLIAQPQSRSLLVDLTDEDKTLLPELIDFNLSTADELKKMQLILELIENKRKNLTPEENDALIQIKNKIKELTPAPPLKKLHEYLATLYNNIKKS